MEPLVIQIDWVFFLGIIGALLGIAWYAQGRFTKLETNVEWMSTILKELKISSDNERNPLFIAHSPLALTEQGRLSLEASGMKAWIEENKESLLAFCEHKRSSNPYEVQEHIFEMFNTYKFPDVEDDTFKRYAYSQGVSMSVLRRVGAIYLRDLCFERFGMDANDIDKHQPTMLPENNSRDV